MKQISVIHILIFLIVTWGIINTFNINPYIIVILKLITILGFAYILLIKKGKNYKKIKFKILKKTIEIINPHFVLFIF